MDRRDFMKLGIAISAAAPLSKIAFAKDPHHTDNMKPSSNIIEHVDEETKSLEELYEEAIIEGGELTVYAGGDTVGQQDGNANAFRKRFPKMKLKMNVDFSKFQDARIDLQLKSNTLAADVAHLQELQNYPRWKNEGVLQPYKPAGFSKVYDKFKDKDGAWVGICVNAFSNLSNVQLAPNPPVDANDYLDPKWKDKIILDYPNDDDATQFLFMKVIEIYGWEWLEKFLKQNPIFVRGGQEPVDQVYSGQKSVAFGVFGDLEVNNTDKARFIIPKTDPFMAWAQRACMFKQTKHPAAARLYLNWWLSEEQQKHWYQWPVRTDIKPKGGYKPIWEYPNAYLDEFVDTMMDRGLMERFRAQLTQYIGEAQGMPSGGIQGRYPDTGH
ncbi:ABC transporter substrate-binding protein [Serratia sp. PL7]|uniref:ABC transporter substrate-binding protein n=1 Tax=Serratia sp. PL7 TaxID=2952201 RepID=UPI0020055591|nr:extracellular solute-binding protein [Serratia sp. PL7]